MDVSSTTCDGGANATVAVTYKDANGDTTEDTSEAVSTNLKFGFTVVPGCDGADGTVVTANGPHTATPLDSDQAPTVVIDKTTGEGTLDMAFKLGIPRGLSGKDGTSIEIIGTIGLEGPPDNSDFPDKGQGDVVVDSNGNGWLWDATNSEWQDIGQFRGPDGKQATFNNPPSVTMGSCDTEASATVTLGSSTETSNIYDLAFTLPKCDGQDGEAGKNAQVIKQSTPPTVDGEGDPVRMGCIWIKTDA